MHWLNNAKYLDGQNWTSSTVSSCPRYLPRAPIEGLSRGLSPFPPLLEAFLELAPPEAVDFAEPGSAAKAETWSWMLHKTTDLSLPVKKAQKRLNSWQEEWKEIISIKKRSDKETQLIGQEKQKNKVLVFS